MVTSEQFFITNLRFRKHLEGEFFFRISLSHMVNFPIGTTGNAAQELIKYAK